MGQPKDPSLQCASSEQSKEETHRGHSNCWIAEGLRYLIGSRDGHGSLRAEISQVVCMASQELHIPFPHPEHLIHSPPPPFHATVQLQWEWVLLSSASSDSWPLRGGGGTGVPAAPPLSGQPLEAEAKEGSTQSCNYWAVG